MKNISFLLLFITCNLFSQPLDRDYIVVTFEREQNKQIVGHYHWLLSWREDDVFELNPISLTDSISRANGKDLDVSFLEKINYPVQSNIPILAGSVWDDYNGYVINGDLLNRVEDEYVFSFLMTVKQNKQKIQTIQKRWDNKKTGRHIEDLSRRKGERVFVYLTPVRAVFSVGWEYYYTSDGKLHTMLAYYPSSIVEYSPGLVSTQLYEMFSYLDYGYFQFASSTPPLSTGDNVGYIIHVRE